MKLLSPGGSTNDASTERGGTMSPEPSSLNLKPYVKPKVYNFTWPERGLLDWIMQCSQPPIVVCCHKSQQWWLSFLSRHPHPQSHAPPLLYPHPQNHDLHIDHHGLRMVLIVSIISTLRTFITIAIIIIIVTTIIIITITIITFFFCFT